MTPASERWEWLNGSVVAVLALATALRLVPTYWSPLPFNPDGIGYASLAARTLATGHFPLPEMATDQVGFTALLSLVSALAGHEPLVVGQPMSAIVGGATILAGVVIARRVVIELEWNGTHVGQAAVIAGLLLAVEGVYLYRSMPTDEQTAGLLLVPLLAIVVDRWLRTHRSGWLAIAGLVGLVLPPLHNLSGLVGASVLTCVCAVHLVRRPTVSMLGRTGALGGIAWAYAIGYHLFAAGLTPTTIVQTERLARVPGLFVAWVLIGSVGAAWFVTTRRRVQRGSVFALLGGVVVGLVGVNAVRTVYPGTMQTPRLVLLVLIPLVVPIGVAALVVDRGVASSIGASVVGLVAGPLVFVGVALTAGLTFDYLAMGYRAQLFVHVPIMALAGVGAVAIAHRGGSLRPAVVVVVVLCAAVSAPVAFAGLDLLSYKGVTTEAEFQSTAFASESFDRWATDDHLARVAGYHGDGASRGAVMQWFRGSQPPPACPVLAQDSWTTAGAQRHPQRPAVLDTTAYDEWLAGNDVVYVAAEEDAVRAVVPVGIGGTYCGSLTPV